MKIFEYSNIETDCLKRKDKKLGEAIEKIGPLTRELIPDLFTGIVSSIISQQISMKAADTIWNRLLEKCPKIAPEAILSLSDEELQKIGITMKKAKYIKAIATSASDGSLDLPGLSKKSDEEVINTLVSLKGIGVWTAEMLMIFSMGRKNILSWNDLAIRRGIMMLYHHKTLDKDRFERYRKRYSPYGTIASLYLWEISVRKEEI